MKGAAFSIIFLLILTTACGGTTAPEPLATDTPIPATATSTSAPSDPPPATETSTPVPIPTPLPPIDLQGTGQTATEEITLPFPVCIASITHNGQRNFIIKTYQADQEEILINHVGAYEGNRPLYDWGDPILLDIDADGDWTIHIEAISTMDHPAFSGRGDSVSAAFQPPTTGSWEISHDGQRNFMVFLHCQESAVIQNEVGAVQGSTVVDFPEGPCFWEVRADGAWSLAPK